MQFTVAREEQHADYYEIDFRQVQTSKSGDAIAICYQIGQHWYVHLVDRGYSTTAPEVASFIWNTYGTACVNNIVVTRRDKDPAEGLASIREQFDVETLWMLRPWADAGPACHSADEDQSAPDSLV